MRSSAPYVDMRIDEDFAMSGVGPGTPRCERHPWRDEPRRDRELHGPWHPRPSTPRPRDGSAPACHDGRMARATLRFHGSLNDFLPAARRSQPIEHRFNGEPGVKDVIEALGVPHPEVDLILVRGEPVGFARRLRDGDTVEVYPRGEGPAMEPGARVGPPIPDEIRFVLDGHLGRLAAYLRMLGFDTWYRNHADDDELAQRSAGEDRILLTRDRGLLKRGIVLRGAFVRSDRPREQLAEIGHRFELGPRVRPFTRCIRCNGVLVDAGRAEVEGRVPPYTFRTHDAYGICPDCSSIYWKGTHHERMSRLIESTIEMVTTPETAEVPADGLVGGPAEGPPDGPVEGPVGRAQGR